MSDTEGSQMERLTKGGLQQAIERIEAHWPGRSKWSNPAAVYSTLAPYSNDVVGQAVTRLIHQGDTWQPGPVEVLNAAKDIIRERAVERRALDPGTHPAGGHVLSLVPEWEHSDSDGMREAFCVLPDCGYTVRAPASKLRTLLERQTQGRDRVR